MAGKFQINLCDSALYSIPLVLPKPVKKWSLITLREKLIKIGAKVVRHLRYIIFQMAEVFVPRALFREILERIGRLRAGPEFEAAG
jgi:hypothetical protein